MKKLLILVLFALTSLNPHSARADDYDSSSTDSSSGSDSYYDRDDARTDRHHHADEDATDTDSRHSTLHIIALYIPNRVLDFLDIFRARLRIGPGLAVDARATEFISAYAGTYATVYAGLPGPRLRSLPKLPFGLESHNGASLSVLDATADGGIGPDYSDSEIGFGFQLAIIGVDFGIDPVEIVDFLGGLVTLDPRHDDL